MIGSEKLSHSQVKTHRGQPLRQTTFYMGLATLGEKLVIDRTIERITSWFYCRLLAQPPYVLESCFNLACSLASYLARSDLLMERDLCSKRPDDFCVSAKPLDPLTQFSDLSQRVSKNYNCFTPFSSYIDCTICAPAAVLPVWGSLYLMRAAPRLLGCYTQMAWGPVNEVVTGFEKNYNGDNLYMLVMKSGSLA